MDVDVRNAWKNSFFSVFLICTGISHLILSYAALCSLIKKEWKASSPSPSFSLLASHSYHIFQYPLTNYFTLRCARPLPLAQGPFQPLLPRARSQVTTRTCSLSWWLCLTSRRCRCVRGPQVTPSPAGDRKGPSPCTSSPSFKSCVVPGRPAQGMGFQREMLSCRGLALEETGSVLCCLYRLGNMGIPVGVPVVNFLFWSSIGRR